MLFVLKFFLKLKSKNLYWMVGHLFRPILWSAQMSAQQIHCKGSKDETCYHTSPLSPRVKLKREKQNSSDMTNCCYFDVFPIIESIFLRHIEILGGATYKICFFKHTLREEIRKQWTEPIITLKKEKMKKKRDLCRRRGCLAKSLRVKQRRIVSRERPRERPTFL